MPYEAICPKGHRLQVTDSHFNERVTCPTCGEPFVVPDLVKQLPSGSQAGGSQAGGSSSSTPKSTARSSQWKTPLGKVPDMALLPLLAGRPMVAIGLVLVLFARGCDGISQRGVDRLEAKVEAAKEQFTDACETQQFDLKARIAALEDSKDRKPDEQKMLADLKVQLGELTARQAKERKLKESGEWRNLEVAARAAKSSHKLNGYWRELFFVFAAIVLTLGLLVVSWKAEGAERWVTLIMLAIITASIFVGGAAWGPLGR